ncbi:MAG TPA: ubiquitin-like small modifier protein 1 [Bryobacteraceae bacterium]|nr:ubiquitin-like small modifier protein 1 [Bryobacteraceae bacterium]
MAVIFHIPGALRVFTEGRSRVEIDSGHHMLRDVLLMLWSRYPGLRDRVATEQGEVREHINIFLGNENIRYLDGLATPVPDGSEITIVPAISGGMHP